MSLLCPRFSGTCPRFSGMDDFFFASNPIITFVLLCVSFVSFVVQAAVEGGLNNDLSSLLREYRLVPAKRDLSPQSGTCPRFSGMDDFFFASNPIITFVLLCVSFVSFVVQAAVEGGLNNDLSSLLREYRLVPAKRDLSSL